MMNTTTAFPSSNPAIKIEGIITSANKKVHKYFIKLHLKLLNK